MLFRPSINRTATSCVFRRAVAAFFMCATIIAPSTALGFSLMPTRGGANEERSELDGSEHVRAALPQFARQLRCKLKPAAEAGVLMAAADSLAARQRAIIAEKQSTPSTDGWTAPLRL